MAEFILVKDTYINRNLVFSVKSWDRMIKSNKSNKSGKTGKNRTYHLDIQGLGNLKTYTFNSDSERNVIFEQITNHSSAPPYNMSELPYNMSENHTILTSNQSPPVNRYFGRSLSYPAPTQPNLLSGFGAMGPPNLAPDPVPPNQFLMHSNGYYDSNGLSIPSGPISPSGSSGSSGFFNSSDLSNPPTQKSKY